VCSSLASPFIGTGLDLIFSLKLHYLIQKTRGQLLHALFSIDKIIICYVGYIHGSVFLPKFRRLGDTGPIIISHEEITCCYLVKSKSVLVTDISANFTAKMIRYPIFLCAIDDPFNIIDVPLIYGIIQVCIAIDLQGEMRSACQDRQ